MSRFRGIFLYGEAFYVMLVLFWGVFICAECESCLMSGLQSDVQYAKCELFKENLNMDVESGFSHAAYSSEAIGEQNNDSVCQQANLFCFRSTLSGFSSSSLTSPVLKSDVEVAVGLKNLGVNGSWMMGSGGFNVHGGAAVSCSLCFQEISPSIHISNRQHDMYSCMELIDDNKNDYTHSVKSDSVFPHIEISPTLLDWGEQYMYIPSSASLTVKNTHSDDILNLYELYSTSPYFYPFNFSEILLAPGEKALVSFIFFPTLLGLSSAQLILQTNAGGFFIHAKGLVVESAYAIPPLVGQDISTGKSRRILSLFNPFNESITMKELAIWVVVSSGDSSSLTKAICSVDIDRNSSDSRFSNTKEWLNIRKSELELPIVSMRPSESWEIAPGTMETVMQVDISHSTEGKVSGAVCMQLYNSTEKISNVMVPLNAKWRGGSTPGEFVTPVSVSIDVLLPCDTNGTVVASLSVRNNALYMLRIVKVSIIGGSRKHFNIKYIEGLLLFPGANTQVALVTYTMAVQDDDSRDDTPENDRSCKVLIQTNDSSTFDSEIHCEKVAEFCLGHKVVSSTGYQQLLEGTDKDKYSSKLIYCDAGSLSPSKVLDSAEADELVLMNWKSHATASNLSVLDDHGITFATVQVGTHFSKWITVTNPSQQPVVIQLILNSAEIIDECQELDRLQLRTSFSSLASNQSSAPARYGFSIAKNGVTEAFLHPYERALLGPIVFHPSKRCGWKSSALIRNNLSGVEWLSLQGFGGSHYLSLLEESEPVQRLDFKLILPARLNINSPYNFRTVDRTRSCSRPSFKELYAKNTGDLPLKVTKVKVSGTECALDGFLVHTCEGFSIEPGESQKFVISYQTDYSAATLYRDLELDLSTGTLVIPMKVSAPMDMFHFCKRSMLLMRVKKYITVFLSILGPVVVVFSILPRLSISASQGYLPRNGESISHTGKCLQHITKNACKFPISSQINGSIKLTLEEILPLKSVCGVSDGQVSHNGDMSLSDVNLRHGDEKERRSCMDKKETISPSPEAALPMDRTHMPEVPQVGNMTLKTGNEKRRRRRKKRSSTAGLPAVFEESSSHGDNSTPSSPLSSSSSSKPQSWPLSPEGNQSRQIKNLFAQDEKTIIPNPVSKVSGNGFSSAHTSPVTPKYVPGKPVLLPSATFPGAGRPVPDLLNHPLVLVTVSKVAPHSSSPGYELQDLESKKGKEKTRLEEKFTYDIWGDHLSGKPLIGQSIVYKKQPYAVENNFTSFFVKDPQTLMKNIKQMSVSSAEMLANKK